MAIEVVDLPIKNGGSFPSYVSLPEGVYIYIDIDIDKDIYIYVPLLYPMFHPPVIPHALLITHPVIQVPLEPSILSPARMRCSILFK